MNCSRRLFVVAVASLALSLAGSARFANADPVFKIYVEHTGVYEISYQRLDESGLGGPLPSATIGLRNLGEPAPVWIEDGGDGIFGPGDRLLFVGQILRGDHSYLDPYSRFNCYKLDFSDPDPWHGLSRETENPADGRKAVLVARHHLEPDQLMVRFRTRPDEPEEVWYWARLSVADRSAFRHELVLDGLASEHDRGGHSITFADALSESLREAEHPEAAGRIRSEIGSVFESSALTPTTVRLRFGFRGWSEPRHIERASLPHHEVEILLNGSVIGTVNWDGTDHHVHELELLSGRFQTGANELSLAVPKRLFPDSGDLVIDVVLLNWIELEYEHTPRVEELQLRLQPADAANRRVELSADDGGAIELYRPDGIRVLGLHGTVTSDLGNQTGEFSALRPIAAAAPNEVVLDRPSDLAGANHQADYLMIAHRSLWAGTERLAAFHRSRGLAVEVVDVQDIYDEFNFGIVSPRAIKDFLQHAVTKWQAPAPRFVLLVGDASWDFKNETADDANYADWTYRPNELNRFIKNGSTSYAEGAELNHRNLVPTASYPTVEGHAASDTWFACLDDGDTLPDMAIGRFPVVTPDELDGLIDKTIAYGQGPPVGPWRRHLLFIANESVSFQRRSDAVGDEFSRHGFVATKIYPHPSEPANEHHTQRIIDVLDEGVQAVHFIGHGGRYIWRTGPADLEKNHDLFTLEHLDQLSDNRRIPVVLSLTCYSAPFDHPTADSIGEKLIRIPGRGAIAVFAASWRNSPSPVMGQTLLSELTTPGNTIGEAVMRSKREFRSDMLVQTYNLLGDPAVEVGAPGHPLDLRLVDGPDEIGLRVEMPIPVDGGRMLVDWVGEDGTTLRQDLVEVTGSVFDLSVDRKVFLDQVPLAIVRAYVWDEENRVDGIGGLVVTPAGNEVEPVPAVRGEDSSPRTKSSPEQDEKQGE